MKQIVKKYWWVITIFLISSIVFYWYEWRPSQIRKECSREALITSGAISQSSDYSFFYELCLKRYGLEK